MGGQDIVQSYVFSDAVKHFWTTRQQQSQSQQNRGTIDQGSRSAVTGGRQMDGFVETISRLVVQAGVSPANIHTHTNLELPGFYRPTKEWDVVVVDNGHLVAAIECKSQVGPSFGNNFNNRTEEAMGSALDIWTAYREGAFSSSPAPWLGYLLLVEDTEKSQSPVRTREPHFSVFPEFKNASYARRYELFCRKLVRERQYSAACFLLSSKDHSVLRENYVEPATDLSAGDFLSQLVRHVSK